jgi:predicted Rossmann fold flavoprotein
MAARKVIVVGAGPAGLMAAGQAARAGAKTVLLEKMSRAGRKLGITGKGRCNLTNMADKETFITHFGRNGRFLHQAFSRFFNQDLIAFFKEIDLPVITERGGRVFPASEDALQVVCALKDWAKGQGASLRTRMEVEGPIVREGRVMGVRLNSSGEIQTADAVILATGGASYPATGSTGDGFPMAEAVGHRVVPIRPALVPMETEGDVASRLQGVSLKNIQVRVLIDAKKKHQAFGEMLFTHFGLSGPVILFLSRFMVDALAAGKRVDLEIDLKPALDEKKLDARLIRELKAHGKQRVRNLLKTLLPRKLIPLCVELTRIPEDKAGHHVTQEERKRLLQWLKRFSFRVIGHRSFEEAIVTAGGVHTREVNPKTMESLLVKGLYFAGEMLDVDGDTGGYNLQAAFSTGWLAGLSAAGLTVA